MGTWVSNTIKQEKIVQIKEISSSYSPDTYASSGADLDVPFYLSHFTTVLNSDAYCLKSTYNGGSVAYYDSITI